MASEVPTEVLYSPRTERVHFRPRASRVDLDAEETQEHDNEQVRTISALEYPYHWGYQVSRVLQTNPQSVRIACFKPTLGTETETEPLREELEQRLSVLQGAKTPHTVIVGFFTALLRHLRKVLVEKNVFEGTLKQLVVAFPLFWTMESCRMLQSALARAANNSGFIHGLGVQTETISGLSFISEPEAAALGILGIQTSEIRMLVSI